MHGIRYIVATKWLLKIQCSRVQHADSRIGIGVAPAYLIGRVVRKVVPRNSRPVEDCVESGDRSAEFVAHALTSAFQAPLLGCLFLGGPALPLRLGDSLPRLRAEDALLSGISVGA